MSALYKETTCTKVTDLLSCSVLHHMDYAAKASKPYVQPQAEYSFLLTACSVNSQLFCTYESSLYYNPALNALTFLFPHS